MSFRDSDTTAGQFTSAVSLAGVFVRYAFYFFGMIVFGLIAFGVIWLWGNRVQVVDLHDESLIWLLPYGEVQKAGIQFRS